MIKSSPLTHNKTRTSEANAYDLVHSSKLPPSNHKTQGEKISSKESEILQKSVGVKVSKDKMEVFLSLSLPENCPPFAKPEVISVLESLNIIHGIDEEKIEALCNDINLSNLPVVDKAIARGSKPKIGHDAKIKYFFEVEPKKMLQEDENGRINFKELNLINNVEQGDLLAQKIPMVNPVAGTNIYGQPVLPDPVKDTDFVPGKNTKVSEDGLKCLAAIDGEVKLEKKMIQVSPIFIIDGDVSLDTGNITFNGTVQVYGDVRSGFSIKAKRDIIIRGMVESAELTAGGNIVIQNGFVAQNKGHIRCRGNLDVKYIDQGKVTCHGDLRVESSILHSDVTCFSEMKLPFARIIGGSTTVVKNIEIRELGTKLGVPTEITVGDKPIINQRLIDLRSQLDEKNQLYEKMKSVKNLPIEQVEANLKNLPDKLAKTLHLVLEKNEEIISEIQTLESMIQKLEILFRMKTRSKLIVNLKVFPNVTIIIGHSKTVVSDPTSACSYFEDSFDQRVRIGPI
tara:strand:+ start:2082 stop:3614 length:1533 start_codon:yes stop_codon:yes gene_type:complete